MNCVCTNRRPCVQCEFSPAARFRVFSVSFHAQSAAAFPRVFSVSFPAQSAAALLDHGGEESRLRVRRLQVEHRRLVPVGRRADAHGLVFDERALPQQGLAVQQAALRQGHPRLQESRRTVRADTQARGCQLADLTAASFCITDVFQYVQLKFSSTMKCESSQELSNLPVIIFFRYGNFSI